MAAMYNPSHLGKLIREGVEAEGWLVTETARRLGRGRVALSRVLERSRWRIGGAVPGAGLVGATQNTGCGCRLSTTLRESGGSKRGGR